MKKWDSIALSHMGRRTGNEDNCLAKCIGKNTWLFAVADGMGGAAEGETASHLAVSSLTDYLQMQFDDLDGGTPDLKNLLAEGFIIAQETISEHTRKNVLSKGMGTTLVALLAHNDLYVWGNIGDSRLYMVDADDMIQLSMDHTHVQDFHEKNGKPASPEMVKRYGHILTKALDGGNDRADMYPKVEPYLRLLQGDVFMLCSDGLFSDKANANTRLMRNYIMGTDTLEMAGKSLISNAYMAGSNDNITLVLASYGLLKRIPLNLRKFNWPPELNEANGQQKSRRQKKKRLWIRAGIVVIPVLLLVICLILYLLGFFRFIG